MSTSDLYSLIYLLSVRLDRFTVYLHIPNGRESRVVQEEGQCFL